MSESRLRSSAVAALAVLTAAMGIAGAAASAVASRIVRKFIILVFLCEGAHREDRSLRRCLGDVHGSKGFPARFTTKPILTGRGPLLQTRKLPRKPRRFRRGRNAPNR